MYEAVKVPGARERAVFVHEDEDVDHDVILGFLSPSFDDTYHVSAHKFSIALDGLVKTRS